MNARWMCMMGAGLGLVANLCLAQAGYSPVPGVVPPQPTPQMPAMAPVGMPAAPPPAMVQPGPMPAGGLPHEGAGLVTPNIVYVNGVPMMPIPTPVRTSTYQAVQEAAFPLRPEQIAEMRRRQEAAQKAMEAPYGIPEAVQASLTADLAPGAPPLKVRVARGHTTVVALLDSFGQAWPIAIAQEGNAAAVKVAMTKDVGTNLLLVTPQPVAAGVPGNLVVLPQGLAAPITIALIADDKKVDYRADIRIPGRSPTSPPPALAAVPDAVNPVLLNLLAGQVPAGARPLSVRGARGQAWEFGGKLLLRTSDTPLSPAQLEQIGAPDGSTAYLLPMTNLVLVSNEHGQMQQMRIGD